MVNIMPNPSVELDTDLDGIPDYWQTVDCLLEALYIWDVDAYDGVRSIAIQAVQNPAVDPLDSCYWFQRWDLDSVDCPFERGVTYRFRGAYRSVNCSARMWVNYRDVADGYIAGAGTGPIRSDVWAESPWFEFTIPAEAKYIHLGFGVRHEDIDVGTTGYVWGDAFECESTAPPPPTCESYLTQAECEAAACYWYDEACHSTPAIPNKEGIPVLGIATALTVVAIMADIYL